MALSFIMKISLMSRTQEQQVVRLSGSFVKQEQPNLAVRILKKMDVFAFIPVPKDDSVSTKQSLVGTAIFFVLFLTYVIIDFVGFVQDNPPLVQSYRTNLDDSVYTLPKFAYAFMNGSLNNQTAIYDNLFSQSWQTLSKTIGDERPSNITFDLVTYDRATDNKSNFDLIPWMSQAAKKFYYVLRTPNTQLQARGLLYSSDLTVYVRVKLFLCNNNTSPVPCLPFNDTTFSYNQLQLVNRGRIFIFIENTPDTSSISLQSPAANGNNYLLYSFFVVPGYYKRVNINYQVIKDTILPDYFLRWSTQTQTRLQVQSIFEELSVSSYNNTAGDAIAFNMQLSPLIINNRVSFATLIDHVSKWGAFWGVLFAIFAILFLSYNRRKFYKKNPTWDKFKKLGGSFNSELDPNR